MKNPYNIEDITEDFIKKNDGKIAWLRWDYLALNGYAYRENLELYNFLEKIFEIKTKIADSGYQFKA